MVALSTSVLPLSNNHKLPFSSILLTLCACVCVCMRASERARDIERERLHLSGYNLQWCPPLGL